MTLGQAAQLVALALANFPNMQERGMEPTAKLWHQMLGHLDYGLAMAAVQKVLATANFWPKVSEIIAAANTLQPTGIPEPAEAFEEVLRQIRLVGWCGRPEWSHPAIQRTVEAFGWLALCQTQTDDLGVVRAQFERTYATFVRRDLERATLPPAVLEVAERLAGKLGLPALPERRE